MSSLTKLVAPCADSQVCFPYIGEAIHVEKAGKSVGPASEPVPVAELQLRLDADPALKVAFEALTPGRRQMRKIDVAALEAAAGVTVDRVLTSQWCRCRDTARTKNSSGHVSRARASRAQSGRLYCSMARFPAMAASEWLRVASGMTTSCRPPYDGFGLFRSFPDSAVHRTAWTHHGRHAGSGDPTCAASDCRRQPRGFARSSREFRGPSSPAFLYRSRRQDGCRRWTAPPLPVTGFRMNAWRTSISGWASKNTLAC